MSRVVLVERVERRRCDGCGAEVDPDNDPMTITGGWYYVDLRVLGLPGPGPSPEVAIHDACSLVCLQRVIHSAAGVFGSYAAGTGGRRTPLRDSELLQP